MAKYEGDPQMETEMSKLSWTEAPQIVSSEIPGPGAKIILEKELANETPTRQLPTLLGCVWNQGRGATVKDPDGNIFIDLLPLNSVGHCHPKVVEVIRKECGTLMFAPDVSSPNRQRLGEKLSQLAPGKLKGNVRAAYGLTGSSAVEIAIKFARAHTKKSYIIAFEGAYHGSIGTTLALSATPASRKYRALSPFVYHVSPYPYCYRCPFNLKYPDCNLECAKYIEFQIDNPHSGMEVEDMAALIVESIQGSGGYVPAPDGFLDYIRNMCKRLGILYIDDDIQTGAGRTGTFFTVEQYGVEPDMIILGKALGGDVPFSGVIFRKDIVEDLPPASHILTAVGNSLSCAVVCTNIDLIQNGLLDRAARLGDYAMSSLRDMAKEREVIGDVRGKGLAIGLELVKNRETKRPLQRDEMVRILLAFRDRGVLIIPCGRYGNTLRFIPSLVITKALLDKVLEVTSEVLKEVEGDILE